MLSRDQLTGLQAELWVYNQLEQRGYQPRFTDWKTECCDIVVDGLPIEVKFATKTYRYRQLANVSKFYSRWQWFIHPTAKNLQGEWVLILVAEDSSCYRNVFVVPGSMIGDREHIQITSHPSVYRGWLSQYLNRWDLIDYLSKQTYKDNGPLFEHIKCEDCISPPQGVTNE